MTNGIEKILAENAAKFHVGQRVSCNGGYDGTVVKVCDGQLIGMLEIRLDIARGIVCVGASEVLRDMNTLYPFDVKFKVGRTQYAWTRFAPSINAAEDQARKAIENEWPGRRYNVESVWRSSNPELQSVHHG